MSSAGHGVHVYGSEALADDAAGHGRQIFAGSSAPSASRSTSTLPSAHAQSPVAASRPSVSSADSESRRSSSSTTTGTGADTLTASTVGPPWHGRHCVPSRVGARPADAHAVHDHAAGVDELSTAGVYVSTPAVHSAREPVVARRLAGRALQAVERRDVEVLVGRGAGGDGDGVGLGRDQRQERQNCGEPHGSRQALDFQPSRTQLASSAPRKSMPSPRCRRTWCSTSWSVLTARAPHRARGADVQRGQRRRALAMKLRRFSGEVVTLAEHTDGVLCVAAAPDGRIITGSFDYTVKVWRDGACERTIQAHTTMSGRWRCCRAERASSASHLARAVRREAVDARRRARAHLRGGQPRALRRGAARRRALCGRPVVNGGRRATSGCTTSTGRSSTPSRGTPTGYAVTVTPDGQHIISGSDDTSSRCGASPPRAS